MSLSEDLKKAIEKARVGLSNSIPFPYSRLDEFMDISKSTMTVVGGSTGAGKTTVTSDIFVIEAIDWYLKNKNPNIKLSVICFFMERAQVYYTARWVARKIFLDTGTLIHPKKILSGKKDYRLTDAELSLVEEYYEMLDTWEKEDLLITHSGSKNPTGISVYLELFAKKHGTINEVITVKEKENKTLGNVLNSKTYTPNHPNHIVIVVGDNSSVLDTEKDDVGHEKNSKALVDKFSRTMRGARDLYGFSPVIVQQLSRAASSIDRIKAGLCTPKLSDFADSSQTQRDADIVIALFDPFEGITTTPTMRDANGYLLERLRDNKFRTFYRTLHVLKNSTDSSGIQIPMALHPILGILKTLPPAKEMTDEIYDSVLSGEFFRQGRQEEIVKKPFKFS